MKINSIEEAFAEIEKVQERVPVEGIEFLYEHEKCEAILQKIIFSFENAYNDEVYYDEATDYYFPAPLWYAIVAENHLCAELVQPIIGLFTASEDDNWDYLSNQGCLLVGKICNEIGDVATKQFLDVIELYSLSEDSYPVLYLDECLFYVDKQRDLPQILRILSHKNYAWLDSFISSLGSAKITGALPLLREHLPYFEGRADRKMTIGELEAAIEELETGISAVHGFAVPVFEKRKPWKKEYEDFFQK